MSSKLSSTNNYMRDPGVRQASVLRSVATSSAIEGIRAPFRSEKTGEFLKPARKALTARRPAKRR